jgi:hypothetical protein
MAVKNLLIKLGVIGDKDAKKKVKKVESSFERLGATAIKVGGAFFAARGMISGISTVVNLAAQQELAERKLQTALGGSTRALLEQASALQKVTTFGDEAIIEQQAFLASLNLSEEQIKKIIPLALDLSSATGLSLESAVRNTAKTFSGLTGELGELLPQLKDLTAEELKAGDALKVISDLMGGSAQENTKTLAGKLEQTKNAVFDAGEALGELLAPAVIHTANAVSFLSGKLVEGGNFIAELITGQEAVTETTKAFASAQGDLAIQTMNANNQTSKQLSDFELINQNNEKILDHYQKQIQSLQLQKLELEGASTLQQELFKLGLTDARGLDGALKDQLLTYIDLKNAVATLQTFKEKDALAERMSFKTFKLEQLQKLDLLKAEQSNIEKFIELYPAQAKALGLVNQKKKEGAETDQKAFATSLAGLRSTIKGFLAQTIAAGFASEVKSKGLGGLATGTAVAIAVSALFDKYVPAFAEGGIVPGSGNQDTVPAMLTPGELILNQSQQENLAQGMGVTVNIGGNIIGEEAFVRDTLIPEIEKARNLA